jgi:glutathione S-transferase
VYILYGGPYTRAFIVEMVMAEGAIAHDVRVVDIVAQEHRSPDYLAINPAGRVPTLITPEGVALYETPAINLYLTERHGLRELAPSADEPERGPFLSGLFYLSNELEPILKRYFYPHRYVLRPEDATAMSQHARMSAAEPLGVIELRLMKAGPYHLGERFSLVDLTLAYWAACLEPTDIFDSCPAIRRCVDLVMGRSKLRSKFAEIRAWMQDYEALRARDKHVT